MKIWSRRACAWAVIGCLALKAVTAAMAEAPKEPLEAAPGKKMAPILCAVIGDVKFPGPYRFSQTQPNLDTLLARAGGLDRAGNRCEVKIVRDRRVAHHANHHLGEQLSHCSLKPNDVVIVRRHSVANDQSGADPQSREKRMMYVALIGLGEHPLILPIYQRRVPLTELVREMRQPADLAFETRLINADSDHLRVMKGQPAPLLTDGMVLIFTPESINFKRLPEIPDVEPFLEVVELQERHSAPRQITQVLSPPKLPDRSPSAETEPIRLAHVDAAKPTTIVAVSESISPLPSHEPTEEESASVNWTPILGFALFLIGAIWMAEEPLFSAAIALKQRFVKRPRTKTTAAPVILSIHAVAATDDETHERRRAA